MKDDRLYLHHIHDYIGVDLEAVWNVASTRIPLLQSALEKFLAQD